MNIVCALSILCVISILCVLSNLCNMYFVCYASPGHVLVADSLDYGFASWMSVVMPQFVANDSAVCLTMFFYMHGDDVTTLSMSTDDITSR